MTPPRSRFSAFLSELRRRRVVRTASVYAVAGWAVAQIVATLAPVLLLPEWFPRAVVLLVILGFPVAIALAWAFDVTPAGIRRTPDADPEPAATPRPPHAFRYAVLGAVVTLVLTAGYLRFFPGGAEGPGPGEESRAIRSIAVLPFVDMSPGGDQEYFSDGISEELLNLLARLPDLQVAARTSSFAFKGRNEHVEEIGRRLNVEAVLEGSVRRDGERLRVTAQLIDARNGFHLWSENYDRDASGVLALQDDISRAIVDALRLHLTGDDPGDPAAVPENARRTESLDPEAHRLYLRGLHHWHRRRTEDFHLAIDYFEGAIERVPDYAQAHAGLALARITITGYDNRTLDAMLEPARSAALRALQLDPESADAHAALGVVAQREHDWEGTERHLRTALRMNPNHVTTHHWLSQHLVAMGRFDEALALARRAVELDPLSLIINNNLGFVLLFLRELDEAARILAATVELDPSFPTALSNLAFAHRRAGRYDEALEVLDQIEAAGLGNPWVARAVTRALRDPLELQEAVAALEAVADEPNRSAHLLAISYADLGLIEEAVLWVERALEDRHFNVPYIAVHPSYEPLHRHPRFERVVRELGLESVPRRP